MDGVLEVKLLQCGLVTPFYLSTGERGVNLHTMGRQVITCYHCYQLFNQNWHTEFCIFFLA